MDESALIAFGILIEESAREILGQTGDLVFTEGEESKNYFRGNTKHHAGRDLGGPAKRRRLQKSRDP